MTLKLLTIFMCAYFCDGANILAIIPTPSFSHQIAFRELWKELSLKGHRVTLVTTDPINDPNLKNLTEINMERSYRLWKISEKAQEGLGPWSLYDFFHRLGADIVEDQLLQREFQDLINGSDRRKFDVVMLEISYPELLPFGKIYNCPVIMMSTIGSPILIRYLGNQIHPVMTAEMNLPHLGRLDFSERVVSCLFQWHQLYIEHFYAIPRRQQIIDRHFGNVVNVRIQDLLDDIDFLIISENMLFKGTRSLSPLTVNVGGGSHIRPSKPLPQELKEFLDSAEEGFIYLSLGGNVKSKDLNNQTMSNIMEAFKEIPYKVLWKFEANNLPGKPDNVKLIRWAPQQDVLRHPNIKVFVTQGGILSVEEAIYTHVPMVVMPFYGDQLKNARIIENKEIGKFVNHKPVLQKDEFKSAIFEVIKDEKYKLSITKLANLIQDQPMTGLETAIWWTEYVIRHKGAKQLRNPAADIPLYQYYLLDVISFLALVLYISIRLSIFLVRKSINFLTGKEKLKSA